MTPCDPRMFEQSGASEFRRSQRVVVVLGYRAFYTLVGGFCSLFGSKKEKRKLLRYAQNKLFRFPIGVGNDELIVKRYRFGLVLLRLMCAFA